MSDEDEEDAGDDEASAAPPRKHVRAYTDGACSGNPGPGGFGVVLKYGNHTRELSGGHPRTTNNQMELWAAVAALQALQGRCDVTLTSDSEYVVKGMTEWLPGWIRRGWRTAAKRPVKNQAIWRTLADAADKHNVTWSWTRGHSGHPENERCDELATKAVRDIRAGAIEAIDLPVADD